MDFWRKALADVQKDSKYTKEDLRDIAKELANANNEYREVKKSLEGAAKSETLFNDITEKTNKTLGEMQRELIALRNTPFDGLTAEDAKAIKQRMADLTADIQDYKNEIKGLDTGEFFANARTAVSNTSKMQF